MSEPALDLSEIMGLYKEDARKSVEQMRLAVRKWDEIVAGGAAQTELRKLAHQLRGSGRTYGFRSVTRIGKALEHLLIKLQEKRLLPDDRLQRSLESLVDRMGEAFK